MTTSVSSASAGRDIKGLAALQRLGRSLMLPIAALPAAGLLLRLGQDDLLGRFSALKSTAAVVGAAGGALYDNMAILFAVGIAIGFARRSDGSTALAAVVGYTVLTGVFKALSPFILAQPADKTAKPNLIDYGVLAGIVVGIVTALLWQRFYRIKLPPYLGFFGGRRFVPIINSVAMLFIGVVLGLVYPAFNWALTHFGNFVAGSTVIGAGVYGIANRLLIPFGLHHIINTFLWFVFGSFTTPDGTVVHGDIYGFMKAHDPHAGTFQTGFFPIFMFALPAAALAIWHTAKPAQKKIVGGIMLSTALVAFVTGITEPIEFSFLFVAWPLFLIHAVLTGTSLALTNALGIHDGFSFSAGGIDYVINYGIATKPLLLIVIGLVYALIYYFVFRWVIVRWNLRTPGREEEAADSVETSAQPSPAESDLTASSASTPAP